MPVLCTRICAYGDGGWCSSVYLSWDIRVAKLAVAKKAPSVSNLPIYLYLVLARSFRFTNFLAPCRFARDQSQNYGVFRLTIFPMEYICFSFLPFFPYLDEWVLLLHCVYIHAILSWFLVPSKVCQQVLGHARSTHLRADSPRGKTSPSAHHIPHSMYGPGPKVRHAT